MRALCEQRNQRMAALMVCCEAAVLLADYSALALCAHHYPVLCILQCTHRDLRMHAMLVPPACIATHSYFCTAVQGTTGCSCRSSTVV